MSSFSGWVPAPYEFGPPRDMDDMTLVPGWPSVAPKSDASPYRFNSARELDPKTLAAREAAAAALAEEREAVRRALSLDEPVDGGLTLHEEVRIAGDRIGLELSGVPFGVLLDEAYTGVVRERAATAGLTVAIGPDVEHGGIIYQVGPASQTPGTAAA